MDTDNNQPRKVEIIAIKPTHTLVRFLSNNHEVKMSKQYFQKRVDLGWYEVVNQDKLSSVI